jgi:Right handed beta helix region
MNGYSVKRARILVAAAASVLAVATGCGGGAGSGYESASDALTASCNLVDANTQGLEGGIGEWIAWYSTTVSRSTAEAKAGSASLLVDITASYGWGVQLANWPGFSAGAGPKSISFWARSGAGSASLTPSLSVHWRNASGDDLKVDTVALKDLTTSWRKASLSATAPEGTSYVFLELTGTTGGAGDSFYVDQVFVGDSTCGAEDGGTPPPADAGKGGQDTGTTPPPHDAGTTPPPRDSGTTPPPSDAGGGGAPSSPPVTVCGNTALLTGPSTAPAGAITVPAGDNSSLTLNTAGATYWFAPGTHTLGTGEYSQIIPSNGDTYLGAPGAVLDGQNLNDFAFTQTASNVTIEYLTIQNFGQPKGNNNQGVVNHDSGQGWVVKYNTIQKNAGAGMMIGPDNDVAYNCLSANGQYGFNAYSATGVSNVTFDHNEVAGNDTDNWEVLQPGCGCSGGGKFWATNGGTVTNNWVHDNLNVGLWADTNNNGFDFENNYIDDNYAEGLMYEISYNALIKNNTFIGNAVGAGPGNPGFPTGAIYVSESGGDSRVAGPYSTLEITGNVFVDNWSGVILWENADRFVGNPDYGSLSNLLTDVSATKCYDAFDPSGSSTASPVTPPPVPYTADCRWHTQNVAVHDNSFSFTTANVTGCTSTNGCGYNGVFSNWGSEYSWEPYLGDVIEQSITFTQNNVFSDNTYAGPWRFMPHDQGTSITFSAWQAAPYNQDVGSTEQ